MPKSKKTRKPKNTAVAKEKATNTQKLVIEEGKKAVLHVGCGQAGKQQMHKAFHGDDWQEIRFDIDESANPHLLGDIREMSSVPTGSMDALYSSHNVEHVYAYEVPKVLSEFFRVLKPGGFAIITLPDMQGVALEVAQGKIETPLYHSPAGPITAQEIMYGHIASLKKGMHYMAHKTAFTAQSLGQRLLNAGFHDINVASDSVHYALWAHGVKPGGNKKQTEHKANIKRGKYGTAVIPIPVDRDDRFDDLDAEPKIWKPLNLKDGNDNHAAHPSEEQASLF